ncbi:hypothetical protein ACER0C_019913 [Sarotherodon galilaeus]
MESRPPRNKQPPANLTTRGQHGREQERASPVCERLREAGSSPWSRLSALVTESASLFSSVTLQEPDLTSRIPANKDGERERGQAARNNKPVERPGPRTEANSRYGRSTFPSVLINESHSELLLKKDVSREQLRV